jgi:hypothetical protein
MQIRSIYGTTETMMTLTSRLCMHAPMPIECQGEPFKQEWQMCLKFSGTANLKTVTDSAFRLTT